MIKLLTIAKSSRSTKKWMAKFEVNGRPRTTHFGANGMSDYTIHKDPERARRYRLRHANDDLDNPLSPGALSYYILWHSPDFNANVREYRKRFGI